MKRPSLLFAICAGAVLLAYAWFFTHGEWTDWPKTTTYYDQLASAFRNGHLELALQPEPALLALPDPYEHSARRYMESPWWDMSFYNGKFYLYWGPVPALMLAALKFLVPVEVSDSYIVFVFITGAFIFNALLLRAIWRRFFQNLPEWTLPAGVLLAGLACPLPWLLNRPKIYEAAIAGGLFFLIGGLYWFFMALGRPARPLWMLALGSFFWTLAIGSRATMVLPVAFMEIMVLGWIAIRSWHTAAVSGHLRAALAMGLPLIVGAIGLGWYNEARFGSPFEFGSRYLLTSANFNKYYEDTFSLAYLPVNLRNYLVNPFMVTGAFPFFTAIPGAKSLPAFPDIPKIYGSEQVTGFFYCFPFALFSLLAGAACVTGLRKSIFRPAGGTDQDGNFLLWMFFGLAGMTLLSFAPMLLFHNASMRYLADVIPSWLVLSLCGFWEGGRMLAGRPGLRRLYFALALGLATASILVSGLLGVAGYSK